MTLYDITEELLAALEHGEYVDEETGEIIPLDLESVQIDFSDKVEGCVTYADNLIAQAQEAKERAKRQTERAKAMENRAERIKERVVEAMTVTGRSVVDGKYGGYRLCKSVKVIVPNMELLSEEYVRTKVTQEADKTAIKKAITAGKEVTGAELVTAAYIREV